MFTKRAITAVALLMLMPAAGSAGTQSPTAPACKPAGATVGLPGLPEASGLAASGISPGRFWTHNDSGKPEIVALDSKGVITGRVSLSGAALDDWEAITSARCGTGTCLYVADIGDNDATRKEIAVYRIIEPVKVAGTVPVDAVIRATYPDGPQNAEALLAAPDGRLYIVTKGDTGAIALYRFPQQPDTNATARLERVGAPLSPRTSGPKRITDGTISPDGSWVVLRTTATLLFYRAEEFLNGTFREVRRIDVKTIREPQGEGISFGPNGSLYLVGEGGNKKRPGTLTILSCS